MAPPPPRRGRRLAGILFALAAVTVAAVAPGSAKTPKIKDWLDGPAHYIATDMETRVWKQIEDDASRANFIEQFWAKRDPTPSTLANEYRQLFWERVREANDKFVDSSRPGWMTDRGKIYVLYGPPTSIEEDLNAGTEGLTATSSRGLIRWLYEGRPAPDKSLDTIVVVPFVRDVSGEYRLSQDPRLASVFFDFNALKDKDSAFWNNWLSTRGWRGGKNDLGVMLDQGTLQAIPSQEEYLIGRVETFETYAAHAVSAELARFEPQGHEAKSLVTVTLSIPESEYATVPSLIARFVPRDAAKLQRILGEGSFHVEGSGADRVTQGRLFLDPGTYDVTLLVADPEGRSNGIQRSKVDVPAPRTGLRLSDVVLASVLDPVAYASLASYEEPYFLGSFRVVPRMGRRLRRGDAVNVFYEIYGGRAPYRIVYRIEGKEDDGRFTPLGAPATLDQAEGAQGWSLPTGDRWPAGDYRVRIEVTDAASGSATATVPFTLAPREQP